MKTTEQENGAPQEKDAQQVSATRPAHYQAGKIQPLDFIEDQKLGFCAGNIVKYVCRYAHKAGLEDLQKARVYLNRLIAQVEGDLIAQVEGDLIAEAKGDAEGPSPEAEPCPALRGKPALFARRINGTAVCKVLVEGAETVTVILVSGTPPCPSREIWPKRDCVLYTQLTPLGGK